MTIWCLYSYESYVLLILKTISKPGTDTNLQSRVSFISFGLGRPSSLVSDDIKVPYPSGRPLIPVIIRLTTIVSTAARDIYSQQRISIDEMWIAAQKVDNELQDLSLAFRKENGLDIEDPVVDGDFTVEQIFLTTCKISHLSSRSWLTS
jgi:hypothetical protein